MLLYDKAPLYNSLVLRNIKVELGLSEFDQPSAPWDAQAKRSELQERSDIIKSLDSTSRSFRNAVNYARATAIAVHFIEQTYYR